MAVRRKIYIDDEGRYVCGVCGEAFENRGKAMVHIRDKHPREVLRVSSSSLSSSSLSSSSSSVYMPVVDEMMRRIDDVERRVENQVRHLVALNQHQRIGLDWEKLRWFVAGCAVGAILTMAFGRCECESGEGVKREGRYTVRNRMFGKALEYAGMRALKKVIG